MKKKVILQAPVLSKSGYGEHSRQIFEYLLSKENVDLTVNILPWGITPWHLNHDDCNGLIKEILTRSEFDKNTNYDVSMQVQLPNEWNCNLAKTNIGVTAMVEADRCNPKWSKENCDKMQSLIFPSEFCKKIAINSNQSLESKSSVVPEFYFKELDDQSDDGILQLENVKTNFNFLTVGMMTGARPELDRKNLFYLIKWFVEEFKNDSNVGLIIKTSQGRDTILDKNNCQSVIKKILNELNYKSNPKIYLLHGDMNRKDMKKLYNHHSVKCFVSITRGEGFGLPMLEASAAGLPVMATDWSAHTEFLNYGKWIKLNYELKEIHPSKCDSEIFIKGARWAEVLESDFKKKIRKFYESSSLPKDNAIKLSSSIRQNYSKQAVMLKYDQVIGHFFE